VSDEAEGLETKARRRRPSLGSRKAGRAVAVSPCIDDSSVRVSRIILLSRALEYPREYGETGDFSGIQKARRSARQDRHGIDGFASGCR